MASPRFTLRIDPEERAEWEARARAAGMSLAEWIKARCRGGDPSPRATPAEVRDRIDAQRVLTEHGTAGRSSPPPDTEHARAKALFDEVEPECPHPKKVRRQLSYATQCGDCGKILKR